MAIVAEISHDDMLSGNLPDTSHKQRFEQAVVQAAATMDAPPYNDNNGKLRKAIDLVLAGKVQAHQDGLYSVKDSSERMTLMASVQAHTGRVRRPNGASIWSRLSCGNGRMRFFTR